MKEIEMTNTATSTPAAACGCSDACCHAIGVDGVREHRQGPAAHDDDATAPEAMDPADEESFVRAVLARAAGEPGRPVETFEGASVSAYQSLAEQRGVSLETVARAVARGRLADVVRMPATTKPSAPVTAGPTDEGAPDDV